MKYLACVLIGCAILVGPALAQDRPITASLIELIAAPEKFDGKLVKVQGYLSIDHEKPNGIYHAFLYLHQEDAKNLLLSNVIVTVPSDQMLRDEEKINHMYVTITGVFHAVHPSGHDSPQSGTIKDIRNCIVWSDPSRPISEHPNGYAIPK